ncbi:YrhK family protein [Neisseria montereyensis]|uniref:YrhK family protein n=1 Tax=Neisseria montereyensis TaxID=2973938 RepID=A0ABT2FC78_9NEIS|nr:YrhK family protein [Neisseria montereyensis]MCS4533814.1 YrhK family protein [Neisseria montereyensis]
MKMTDQSKKDIPIELHLGSEELIIHQRYETLSIANDLLIGIWFLVGSVLFLYPSQVKLGTYLFIIGSVEMLIRPAIRFCRRVHLQRYHADKHIMPDTDF